VLPSLRVLRFTTITVSPRAVTLSTRRSQQPVQRAVTLHDGAGVTVTPQFTPGTYTGSLGGALARED
jgi:hypothetical protein